MEKILASCDHVGLLTNNARGLEGFYMEKFGFKKEKETVMEKVLFSKIFGIDSSAKFIRLKAPNMKLEIFEPVSLALEKHTDKTAGFNHWGYVVGHRAEFCAGLKRKNVDVIEVEIKGDIKYFVKDPDANLIEIRD